MSIRSRTRNILIAGLTSLGAAGVVVVVANFPPGVNNIGMDSRLPSGVGVGECVAILEPPAAQCPALMLTGGEPPGDVTQNPSTRVARALEAMRSNDAIESWHCESATIDAGSACFCEMRGTIIRRGDGSIDGQAPAWRDVIDAAGVGSIVKDGRLSARPAYAKRGACRAHVYAGEDPCASSVGFDGGVDVPDGG